MSSASGKSLQDAFLNGEPGKPIELVGLFVGHPTFHCLFHSPTESLLPAPQAGCPGRGPRPFALPLSEEMSGMIVHLSSTCSINRHSTGRATLCGGQVVEGQL